MNLSNVKFEIDLTDAIRCKQGLRNLEINRISRRPKPKLQEKEYVQDNFLKTIGRNNDRKSNNKRCDHRCFGGICMS